VAAFAIVVRDAEVAWKEVASTAAIVRIPRNFINHQILVIIIIASTVAIIRHLSNFATATTVAASTFDFEFGLGSSIEGVAFGVAGSVVSISKKHYSTATVVEIIAVITVMLQRQS
jgi:hypothetical protein